MTSILFVEDDPELYLLVRAILPEYTIHIVDSVGAALATIPTLPDLDLVLLDIHLADGSGLEVARHLRAQASDVAIVICTGQASVDTAIDAIDLDVSAYLRKPFTVNTLRAAVKNALYRLREARKTAALARHMQAALALVQQADAPDNIYQDGPLHLDRDRYEASYNNHDLGLSPAQFRVLWLLVQRVGEPVGAVELVQEALGYAVEEGEARRLIKGYISHLRTKLDALTPGKTRIQTIRNSGYMWVS